MANLCIASVNNIQAISNKTSICNPPEHALINVIYTRTYTEPAIFNYQAQAFFKTFKEPFIQTANPAATTRPTTGQFWPRSVTQRTVAVTNTTALNTIDLSATYGAF